MMPVWVALLEKKIVFMGESTRKKVEEK